MHATKYHRNNLFHLSTKRTECKRNIQNRAELMVSRQSLLTSICINSDVKIMQHF